MSLLASCAAVMWVALDKEIEEALERLKRCNPHIDPRAIEAMVMPASDAELADRVRAEEGDHELLRMAVRRAKGG